MINMIGDGEWFGENIKIFYKKFEGYYSVSKTKSFRLNQKKGWDAFNFCFFILRRECVGAR
jgi:hypothetical protein